MEIELTMPLPWIFFNPHSITLHLDESIIMGTLQISGSDATNRRNLPMASSESISPSSMLISMIFAPFSICCQADRVCIALVSTIIFEEEDEDIPHWIVITGEDNGILTVNNPIDDDVAKSHRPIYFDDLYTNVEMYKETTLITVGKKSLDKELVPKPELSTKYLEYVR